MQVGADATSDALVLNLRGFEGVALDASADMVLDLVSAPSGVVFRDAADTVDVTSVTIPAFESQAAFRVRSDTPGSYEVVGGHVGAFVVAGASQALSVTPKPMVGSVAPASVAKAQTTSVVVTGTGFAQGATVQFSGNDVTVDSVLIVSPTELLVNITIDATSDLGARDITVTNADGGTSTTENALNLTAPALTANDDGPFDVVEGGNRTILIADLLANDTSTGSTPFVFNGVPATNGVTVESAGDGALLVSAPADSGGTTASFTYAIRDTVFDTTATATVDLVLAYAPVEAILFTDANEFADFTSIQYTVPTFANVFATWPRFEDDYYFPSGSNFTGDSGEWMLDGDTIVQPANSTKPVGFLSIDSFEYYTHEATVWSSDGDDDGIGLVAAYSFSGAENVALVADRNTGGLAQFAYPHGPWVLNLMVGSTIYTLAEPDVDDFTTRAGWSGAGSRIKVERVGDLIRVFATDWITTDYTTATPAYDPQSEILVDLAAGTVTYRSTAGVVTENVGISEKYALERLRGAQPYGYASYSQPDSRYYNVAFEGGAAQDTAILLTGYDVRLAAYTGSEVWRFHDGSGWSQTTGTIQTELDSPRDVTSVASPNPGSAYPGGYAVFGDRFRIEETKVVALVD